MIVSRCTFPLVTLLAFLNIGVAHADFSEATILFAPDRSKLDELRRDLPLVPDSSGFRVIPQDGIVSLRAVDAPPIDNSGRVELTPGGFILVCFRAEREMNVRVVFTDVDGNWHPMVPTNYIDSARVRRNVIYCADLAFQVPNSKGQGKVWIVGTIDGEPPRPVRLPGVTEDAERPAKVYEDWLRYLIK